MLCRKKYSTANKYRHFSLCTQRSSNCRVTTVPSLHQVDHASMPVIAPPRAVLVHTVYVGIVSYSSIKSGVMHMKTGTFRGANKKQHRMYSRSRPRFFLCGPIVQCVLLHCTASVQYRTPVPVLLTWRIYTLFQGSLERNVCICFCARCGILVQLLERIDCRYPQPARRMIGIGFNL